MHSRELISGTIKLYMEKNHKTLRGLAREIGMPHTAIYRILSCNTNYTIDSIERVLDGLGLEIYVKKKES